MGGRERCFCRGVHRAENHSPALFELVALLLLRHEELGYGVRWEQDRIVESVDWIGLDSMRGK